MASDDLGARLHPLATTICEVRFPGFTISDTLGAGASAAVYEIVNGEQKRALKVYDPRFFSGRNQRVERKRITLQLQLRDHGREDLVNIIDADEFKDSAFILMEHIPWIPLDKAIGSVSATQIPGILRQISSASKYLEDRGLTHRDIKPANIMVSPDHTKAKLLDLGVVKALAEEEISLTDDDGELPFVATVQYSSPEYLFRIGTVDHEFWRGLTFYQLGGVLHDMLRGEPLFHKHAATKNKYVLAYAVLFEQPHIPLEGSDPALVSLARNALQKSLPIRMRRVSWADFLGQDASESELRARLGLGGTGRRVVDRAGLEARRLQLHNGCEHLRAALTDVLREQDYPAATIDIVGNGISERVLRVEFSPPAGEYPDIRLRFNVTVRCDDTPDIANVSVSGLLARFTDPHTSGSDGPTIWSCHLSELESEAAAAAIQAERQILRIYADSMSSIDDYNLNNSGN